MVIATFDPIRLVYCCQLYYYKDMIPKVSPFENQKVQESAFSMKRYI